MVDTKTALEAHRNLRWIADHWPDLRARLHPARGSGLNGMPGHSADPPSPIDLHVSDLMFEITEMARYWAEELVRETDDWRAASWFMPELLVAVADRYGHWTADEERVALEFTDWAEDYRGRVKKALERPPAPRYIGPCQSPECDGELYLRPGKFMVTCHVCGLPTTEAAQMEFVEAQLRTRLMERREIVSALMILGHPTPPRTVDTWIDRGRLPHVADGLYRLETALELARARRGRKAS